MLLYSLFVDRFSVLLWAYLLSSFLSLKEQDKAELLPELLAHRRWNVRFTEEYSTCFLWQRVFWPKSPCCPFLISEYLEGTSSSFCLQAFPCIWPCYKQQMRERSVLSKPCSALQFIQNWAACLAGSGAGITTWHSAREHDLCHAVKERSSHASFIHCITEPMRQKLILRKWNRVNEHKNLYFGLSVQGNTHGSMFSFV